MIGAAGFNQAPKEQKLFFQVVDSRTMEVVEEIDVTGKSEKQLELLERGFLRNMDRDNFFCGTVAK